MVIKHNKRPRNTVARTAMFRKAGVHEKSKTAKRRQQRKELENAVLDYLNPEASTNRRGFSLFGSSYLPFFLSEGHW